MCLKTWLNLHCVSYLYINTVIYTTFTRNTLHCDQSNVYSPRVIFSSISSKLLSFLSLHTVGQLATVPCEISLQSPVISVNSDVLRDLCLVAKYTYSGRTYMGSGSDDPLQSYGYLKFSKMCERTLRSVVGRQINIHTSYTDLIILLARYVRNVAREE